ncbi:MAG: tyrosyl-tRNA synthetase [Actinomycetota bacterium]|jgi:tyrosyl-tRNA synthetase
MTNTTKGLLADLRERGLVHDSTDAEALEARLDSGPIGVYVGFDPTADSLHVGHLLGQVTLRRFQDAGHRVFPLAGGATGMVGDPSGRSEERNLLDVDTLRSNVAKIKVQLESLLDFDGHNKATLVDNADWMADMGALTFLRDVGKHITINQMLAKESVKNRLTSENGLSYTEFSYMLLQANDFRHLCEHHDVELQMGGSDQWGNITAGIDLIRKTLGRSAFGITWPLVTKSDGTKFGKTASGAVWLDATRTSPYQFRQFWMQMTDADVDMLFPRFSLRSLEEVNATLATHRADPGRRVAQRSLADEMTSLVHGDAAAAAASAAADVLFGGDPTTASREALTMVSHEVATSTHGQSELSDVVGILVGTGLASSNSDARRGLQQKGFRANGVQLGEDSRLVDIPLLHGQWLLLRKGKTGYHLVQITS